MKQLTTKRAENTVKPIVIHSLVLILFLVLTIHSSYSQQPWIIKPGVGVGPFKLGMHMDKVISILGKPDSRKTVSKGKMYDYPKYGLTFGAYDNGIVVSIAIDGWGKGKTFKTIDNVKIHTDYEELIDKWGRPLETEEGYKYNRYYWPGIIIRTMPGWGNRVTDIEIISE